MKNVCLEFFAFLKEITYWKINISTINHQIYTLHIAKKIEGEMQNDTCVRVHPPEFQYIQIGCQANS